MYNIHTFIKTRIELYVLDVDTPGVINILVGVPTPSSRLLAVICHFGTISESKKKRGLWFKLHTTEQTKVYKLVYRKEKSP